MGGEQAEADAQAEGRTLSQIRPSGLSGFWEVVRSGLRVPVWRKAKSSPSAAPKEVAPSPMQKQKAGHSPHIRPLGSMIFQEIFHSNFTIKGFQGCHLTPGGAFLECRPKGSATTASSLPAGTSDATSCRGMGFLGLGV